MQEHISVVLDANFNVPFPFQCSPHLETSRLICNANQLISFYEWNIAVKGGWYSSVFIFTSLVLSWETVMRNISCRYFLFFSLSFITIYTWLLSKDGWNSVSYLWAAATRCWFTDSFLLSPKLFSSSLISILCRRQSKRAFNLPKAHSVTIPADDNQKPKNCSWGVLPPFAYSFIMNGRKGYACSPTMQIGTWSSLGTVTFSHLLVPFRIVSFKDELAKIRASSCLATLWRHQKSHKTNWQLLDSSMWSGLSD